MKETYEIGDDAWIYGPYHEGNLSKGKVIHKFIHHDFMHYIVEVQTPIEPVLHVRDALTMSDSERGPIGMWSRSFKGTAKLVPR